MWAPDPLTPQVTPSPPIPPTVIPAPLTVVPAPPPAVIPAKAGIQGGSAVRGIPLTPCAPATPAHPPLPRNLPPLPSPHMAVAQRPPATLCHPPLVTTAYTFYSYGHQPPMKVAREVGCRELSVRWRRSCCAGERPLCRGGPATLPPHGRRASDPARQRGAEARAPIRRRRAHSHRPGLCSDNVGRKLPRLWSRGRRASPRQRGSSLGRRRSDVVPSPTKPVQPLTPPRRERPPVHATARSNLATLPYKAVAPATPQPPTVIPAKAGIHRAARGAIPYGDRPRRPRVPPPTWL